MWACLDGHKNVVKLLVDYSEVVDINIPDDFPISALIFESIDTPGLIKCMEVSETWTVLARSVLVKRPEGVIYMKIFEACKSGKTQVAQLLLEDLDDDELFQCTLVSKTWKNLVDQVLMKRWNGKMFEACKNGETKVVQQLLEHCSTEDSGLNVKGQFGFTALMEACKHGHKDVVQLLLDNSDKNIDLNARNHWGRTAIMWACRNGHKDVVQLFLDNSERNIDLNARSDRGLTALMYACIHHGDIYRSIFKNNKNIFAVGPSTI